MLTGSPQEILAKVQQIMVAAVPNAVCELKDYQHKIGCGAEDRWGGLQEVIMLKRELDEETVRHNAKVLEVKVRTGGSTAG